MILKVKIEENKENFRNKGKYLNIISDAGKFQFNKDIDMSLWELSLSYEPDWDTSAMRLFGEEVEKIADLYDELDSVLTYVETDVCNDDGEFYFTIYLTDEQVELLIKSYEY